jgi:hypothetical protein
LRRSYRIAGLNDQEQRAMDLPRYKTALIVGDGEGLSAALTSHSAWTWEIELRPLVETF